MVDLVDALNTELELRGWSMSELGRRAGLSHSLISQVMSGHHQPSADFCIAIGRAFNQHDRWLRIAGHLPPQPQTTTDEHEFLNAYRSLPREEREIVKRQVNGLAASVRSTHLRGESVGEPRGEMETQELIGHAAYDLNNTYRQLYDTLSDVLKEEDLAFLFTRLLEFAAANKARLGREDDRSRPDHNDVNRPVVALPRGDRVPGVG